MFPRQYVWKCHLIYFNRFSKMKWICFFIIIIYLQKCFCIENFLIIHLFLLSQEHVVSILLRAGRREPTGVARCISLSSLGIYVYRELTNETFHPKVPDAINVLLLALKVSLFCQILMLLFFNSHKINANKKYNCF